MRKLYIIVLIAVAGLAATVAVGCGAGSSSSGDDELTLGFAMPDSSESFWTSYLYGVQQEAERQGVNLITASAGGDANANKQISQIQDLRQRGADAMIVGATNGDAIAPVVDQVASEIPVIGASTPPNTDELTSSVFTDNEAMGKIQAGCLGGALNGNGTVAMLVGPPGQLWATSRAQGFKDSLAKKYPQLKVVATSRMADNTNAALTETETWLQRYPDLSGIYSATDDIGAGAVAALKAANRDVKVSTSNFSKTAEDFLKDGSFVCTAAQEIVKQGELSVKTAIEAARGEKVEEFVITPVDKIDKSNIDGVDLSAIRAPVDFKP